ncbi:hypothetical protein ACFLX4_00565 [Chloroflexota bacterium]
MEITSPDKFAAWFNLRYPGAYRQITTEDVRDMTSCGLIHRYRYYSPPQDGETIRAILQYEQMREKRSAKQDTKDRLESPSCKMCSQPLPIEPKVRKGRPREYCSSCELLRNRERYRRWRERKKKLLVESTSGGA